LPGEVFEPPKFADVNFVGGTGDKTKIFHVNSAILGALSMFTHQFLERQQIENSQPGKIGLPEDEPAEMKCLLEILHLCDCSVNKMSIGWLWITTKMAATASGSRLVRVSDLTNLADLEWLWVLTVRTFHRSFWLGRACECYKVETASNIAIDKSA
jgi:hypothetical protein